MKVVFFNRFFHPDETATAQLLGDLAFHLAAIGHEVHVVAGGSKGQPRRDVHRGVQIHRVADNGAVAGLAPRALAYLRYVAGARAAAIRLLGPGDLAVLKTDPPLLSVALGGLAAARGACVIAWLQDLFPEVARVYGVPGAAGVVGAGLEAMRNRSLRRADGIVAVSDAMAARIARAASLTTARLSVIHNWADGRSVAAIPAPQSALRGQLDLGCALVVGYSGNLGRVHEFGTLLGAAARLRRRGDIRFLIVGRGPRLDEVWKRAREEHLDNIAFLPPQPRERLGDALAAADLHVAVLDPRFEGLAQPSKLYGIMAAGRPTLFVGDTAGETASILHEAGAGTSVPCGDSEGLARAIEVLAADAPLRAQMGARARGAFEARYDMPLALARWCEVLERAAAGATARGAVETAVADHP